VAPKAHRSSLVTRNFLHLAETFSLKLCIPDGQYLVNDQNFRFQMRSDRKGETHIHTRRIALYRRVEKFLYFCEGNDLVEFALDLDAALMPRIAPFKKMFSRPVSSG
jgi:hypothetical protein